GFRPQNLPGKSSFDRRLPGFPPQRGAAGQTRDPVSRRAGAPLHGGPLADAHQRRPTVRPAGLPFPVRPRLPPCHFPFLPPEAHGIRYQYLPLQFFPYERPVEMLPPNLPRELLFMSVVNLHGTYLKKQDQYRWLDGRTPVARIGYSIFVYDLTRDADAHFQ